MFIWTYETSLRKQHFLERCTFSLHCHLPFWVIPKPHLHGQPQPHCLHPNNFDAQIEWRLRAQSAFYTNTAQEKYCEWVIHVTMGINTQQTQIQIWAARLHRNIASGSPEAISLHGPPKNLTNIATLLGRASTCVRSHFTFNKPFSYDPTSVKHSTHSPLIKSMPDM